MVDRTPQTLSRQTRLQSKAALKRILGELPLTAEIYWQLRQGGAPPFKNYSFHRIADRLPELCSQAEQACQSNTANRYLDEPRNILLFVTLRYWIEHGIILALSLAGLGHNLTLLFLPSTRWDRLTDRFDARRLNAYTHKVLSPTSTLINPVSLVDITRFQNTRDNEIALPQEIAAVIREVSIRDTQYTLQIEEVDQDSESSTSGALFHLRQQRNLSAARATFDWLKSLPDHKRVDLVLVPNGSILEMGALYQVARYLAIPVVTYEFGEQRGRIWLAKNSEVMLQETNELWFALQDQPLNQEQWEQMRALYNSRQNASLWENFGRLWQGLPQQGGAEVRQALNLDSRPVVLLAANVVGDSLTLGRQIFTQNMTDWLVETVKHFFNRADVQLIIRIHPGERYTKGPSVADIIQNTLSEIPDHIHLVKALDPINTYDLIEIADLGLVYTTTVGMEMAMSGVPVVVSGATHYRGKNFTMDPSSWSEFNDYTHTVLKDPRAHRMTSEKVQRAWQYAYRFYFNFPCPFPWHLLDLTETLDTWPLKRALSEEGLEKFGSSFGYLAGEGRDWKSASA